jgi:hypothetical protein
MMYLRDLWRQPFSDPVLTRQIARMDATAQRATGYSAGDYQRIALTATPKACRPANSTPVSRTCCALLAAYLGRVPDGLSPRVGYDDAVLDQVHLAWAGPTEPGRPLYYRLQDQRLLIEYNNTQRNANHAHSVWRDLAADFGYDALGAHPATAHRRQ